MKMKTLRVGRAGVKEEWHRTEQSNFMCHSNIKVFLINPRW